MKSFNGENSCCAIAVCEWADHAPLTSRVGSSFSGGWNWMWRTQRSALCNICGSGERWKTVISQPWASTMGRTDHTFQSIRRLFYSVIRCFIAFINQKKLIYWEHNVFAHGDTWGMPPGNLVRSECEILLQFIWYRQRCWYSVLEEHAQSLWVTCYDHRVWVHTEITQTLFGFLQ